MLNLPYNERVKARVESILHYPASLISCSSTQPSEDDLKKRVDYLNFVLGYEYSLKTIHGSLPLLGEANFDKIYIQFSAFHYVERIGNTPINAEELDKTVLYANLTDGGESIKIFWKRQDGSLGKNSLTLRNCSEDKELLKLLPELAQNEQTEQDNPIFNLVTGNTSSRGQTQRLLSKDKEGTSRNPILLKRLAEITYETSKENNILICSVKHYEGKYKTLLYTSENNGTKENPIEINQNTELNDLRDKIITLLEDAAIINRGLTLYSDNDEKFLPDDYKAWQRLKDFRVLSLALSFEPGFMYLLFFTATLGWESLIPILLICEALGGPGAVTDFIVNICSISPSKDASYLAVRKLKTVSSFMKMIVDNTNRASAISYYVGGAANGLVAIELTKYLAKQYNINLATYFAIVLPSLWIASVTGKKYYEVFNMTKLLDTFDAADNFLKAEKVDRDHFRGLAAFTQIACVVLFRAIGFGGLGVLDLEALTVKNGSAILGFSLLATVVTAINILATRAKPIMDKFYSKKFAYLKPEEITKAWQSFDRSDYYKALCSSYTLESLIMAVGITLLNNLKNDGTTYGLAAIGLMLFINMCYARIRYEQRNKAVETLERAGVDITERMPANLQKNKNENESPLDKDIRKRVAIAEAIFVALREPHTQGCTLLVTFIIVCCLFSVLTRGLGFLGYTDIVKGMLKVAVTFNITPYQLAGIIAILIVSNLRNMFHMFSSNMGVYLPQKLVEINMRYLNTREENQSFSQWITAPSKKIERQAIITEHMKDLYSGDILNLGLSFVINFAEKLYELFKCFAKMVTPHYLQKACSRMLNSNISFFIDPFHNGTLYTANGYEYTIGEVRKTVEHEIAALQSKLNPVTDLEVGQHIEVELRSVVPSPMQ